VTFRRRTFPEVVDTLLTDLAGGVGAEAQPFPPPGGGPPFRMSLQQPPVADIASVHGTRDGQPRAFRKNTDYRLLDDKQTVEWIEGADLPDAGTVVLVNYLPASTQPVLTDLQTGSVVRTLAEAIGLEIARLYAQMEAVYRSGFVDTAEGASLDNVVAVLGIERVTSGRAAGEVQFTRSAGSRGLISIPAGTRIMTEDGEVEYETTQPVTMAETQTTIRVIARDLEPNDPLTADSLTVLPAPIAGIVAVTNPGPTAIATQDETDAELRTRAKNFLHGSERATLGALRQAVARQQITADIDETSPGQVLVTPHAETLPPELRQRLLAAIQEARPAGVDVQLAGATPPQRVNLELRLVTASGLPEADLRAAQRAVRERVEDYFRRLPVREPGSVNRIVGLVLGVPEVQDVRLLSATVAGDPTNRINPATGVIDIAGVPTVLGELRIADPALPTLLRVVVTFPTAAAPPDRPQMEAALTAALAYLNTVNAAELPAGAPAAEVAKRTIGYGKLLRVLPLPGKPGASLQTFDDATAPPALPDETTIAPYHVSFAITLESGVTQLLERAADAAYTLTPFERLALDEVELAAEI
jgi:hypothetical protein